MAVLFPALPRLEYTSHHLIPSLATCCHIPVYPPQPKSIFRRSIIPTSRNYLGTSTCYLLEAEALLSAIKGFQPINERPCSFPYTLSFINVMVSHLVVGDHPSGTWFGIWPGMAFFSCKNVWTEADTPSTLHCAYDSSSRPIYRFPTCLLTCIF